MSWRDNTDCEVPGFIEIKGRRREKSAAREKSYTYLQKNSNLLCSHEKNEGMCLPASLTNLIFSLCGSVFQCDIWSSKGISFCTHLEVQEWQAVISLVDLESQTPHNLQQVTQEISPRYEINPLSNEWLSSLVPLNRHSSSFRALCRNGLKDHLDHWPDNMICPVTAVDPTVS